MIPKVKKTLNLKENNANIYEILKIIKKKLKY